MSKPKHSRATQRGKAKRSSQVVGIEPVAIGGGPVASATEEQAAQRVRNLEAARDLAEADTRPPELPVRGGCAVFSELLDRIARTEEAVAGTRRSGRNDERLTRELDREHEKLAVQLAFARGDAPKAPETNPAAARDTASTAPDNECVCEGISLFTGEQVTCAQCGRESAGARKHFDSAQRLAALEGRQPPSELEGEDAGKIDDMLAMFQHIQRKRMELYTAIAPASKRTASSAHSMFLEFDRALLPWAKRTPRHIEQLSKAPSGTLRALIANPGLLSDEQLLEAVRTLSKRHRKQPDDEILQRVVNTMNELATRGMLPKVAALKAAKNGTLYAYVMNVFEGATAPIERAAALTGLSKKTIEDACSLVNREQLGLDERDRHADELTQRFDERVEGFDTRFEGFDELFGFKRVGLKPRRHER